MQVGSWSHKNSQNKPLKGWLARELQDKLPFSTKNEGNFVLNYEAGLKPHFSKYGM
jgi:hypothetical protein